MKRKDLTIIIFGVVVLVFLNLNLQGIRNFFYLISSPVQKVLWRKGSMLSNSLETFFRARGLKQENDALVLRIEELLVQNAELREVKKENETLRQALKIDLAEDLELFLVDVVSKDFGQDFILIDKGRSNGLSLNMPVITSKKVLVGRIDEVFENFSMVILISSQESSLGAEIQNKEIEGVAKGKGGLSLYFNLVDVDKNIEENDIVTTSRLDKTFPQGLLIGHIKSVERRDVEPFQTALIEPAFDINRLANLFVICNYK